MWRWVNDDDGVSKVLREEIPGVVDKLVICDPVRSHDSDPKKLKTSHLFFLSLALSPHIFSSPLYLWAFSVQFARFL